MPKSDNFEEIGWNDDEEISDEEHADNLKWLSDNYSKIKKEQETAKKYGLDDLAEIDYREIIPLPKYFLDFYVNRVDEIDAAQNDFDESIESDPYQESDYEYEYEYEDDDEHEDEEDDATIRQYRFDEAIGDYISDFIAGLLGGKQDIDQEEIDFILKNNNIVVSPSQDLERIYLMGYPKVNALLNEQDINLISKALDNYAYEHDHGGDDFISTL
jgi:hypothetical protein